MTPQELKDGILLRAMQGKLAEQKEEGNAIELLKEHNLPLTINDEFPFEIPENWAWTTVKDTTVLINGRAFKPSDWTKHGLPIVRIQNLNNENSLFNYYDGPVENEYLLNGGELLFAWSGTPGTSFGAHIWGGGKAVLNQHIFKIEFDETLFDKKYFMYALNQRVETLIRLAHGSAGLQHITKGVFQATIIPLPPLAEQKRIVAKIEELLPLVDRYEKAWTKLEDFNHRFPVDMQKSILQLAIEGKLVEQRPEEGTGEELYQQIQAEKQKLIKEGKIKKEKPLPEITEDEIPFEIPDGWKWVRLRDICTKIIDGDHNPPAGVSYKTQYFMLSAQNIGDGKLQNLDNLRYLEKDVFEIENNRTFLNKGDLLFTIVGTLGRSCIFEGGYNLCFQRSVSVISTLSYNKYLKYTLDSPFIQNFMVANSTGTAQKGFYLNQVAKLIIPLPPLAEQKRIVAKIEELLPLCERLK